MKGLSLSVGANPFRGMDEAFHSSRTSTQERINMRLMRWQRPDLTNWGSLDQLSTLREEINRLFESPSTEESSRESGFFGWAPVVDIYENHDCVMVKAELPGMKKEDIEISLHQGSLIISGERKSEGENGNGDSSRSERFFGRFQRALELPQPVDPNHVTARYKDGILTVTLPKTEESKPKQITVKAD
jgi:HSP20 family protein